MTELAIGLGIALNLILTEVFGLASAGLVVPGYLALCLNQPSRLAATFIVALATWLVVRHGLTRLVVLYGRRRFGVTVLVGFLLNGALTSVAGELPPQAVDLRAIGFIVPGLIANTAIVQGVWPTIGLTLAAAGVVRLLLMVIVGLS
jgi:gamma-polyglutamate biosynthesis protein CapC